MRLRSSDPEDETLSGTGMAVIVLRVDGVMASDILDDGGYLYPTGEVLFMFVVAGDGAPTPAEVMAELP